MQKDRWKGLVLIALGVGFLAIENLRYLVDITSPSAATTLETMAELPTFLTKGYLLEGRNDTTVRNSSLELNVKRSGMNGNFSAINALSTLQPQNGSERIQLPTTTSHSSFCLLTKDDNDILPEWIAYHYHTMNMRRIIVALDPNSETSPNDILQKWHSIFGLNVTLWTDPDYMPQEFLNGDFSNVPNYLKGKLSKKSSYWHQNQNVSQAQIRKDLQRINHHRYRQRTFLAECYRHLKQEGQRWTVHVDSDEFVTLNPLLRQVMAAQKKQTTTTTANIEVPSTPLAGSLLKLWEAVYEQHGNLIGSITCGLMPCLPFGSRESHGLQHSNASALYNKTNFETLRWQFHGEHAPRPKSIVNVALIPDNHKCLQEGRVFDPHIPLFRADKKHDCHRRDIAPFNVTKYEALELRDEKAILTVLSYPLYINHYLGSLDRFLTRSDARRSESIYREKAKEGDGYQGDSWIQLWLSNFVQNHEIEKVKQVLEH